MVWWRKPNFQAPLPEAVETYQLLRVRYQSAYPLAIYHTAEYLWVYDERDHLLTDLPYQVESLTAAECQKLMLLL